MTRIQYSAAILLIILVTDTRSQFFDFFGFQPVLHQYQTVTVKPTIQQITTEITTKRHNRRKHTTTKPITAISYDSHDLERDINEKKKHNAKDSSTDVTNQQRRKTTVQHYIDFNSYSSTLKPKKKTTKNPTVSSSQTHNNRNRNDYTTRNSIYNDDLSNYYTSTNKYDYESNEKHKETTENKHVYYEKPISSNIADEYYNHTTRYQTEHQANHETVYNSGSNNKNSNYYVTDYSNANNNANRQTTTKPYNNNFEYNKRSYTTKGPSYSQNNYNYNYNSGQSTKKPSDYNNEYDINQQSHTTKRTYSQNNNDYNYHNQNSYSTRKPDYTSNSYDYSNSNNENSYTTKRPSNTQNNNQRYTTKNPYNNQQRYTTKHPEYNQHYTTKSNSENNNEYYNNNNYQTTKNPLIHRPGVKPAVDHQSENRPPITNRPVTNRPTTRKPVAVFPRPTDAGSISFPEDVDGPEILTGPDEDYMTQVEKKRYFETAEKMCDKYKSLNMKQVQAIPLLPSPVPVQVNISNCAPTNVPLVVGGKVVTINEFPHMALLGWVKLENGGYSWKCGGSLISEQYVLTAAHCAYQERDNTVVIGAPRVVQLGSSYLDDPGALVVRISAVIRHPKFKSPKSYYDIALVKLVKTIVFSEVIKPACLGEPPPPDQPIIATGWGQTKFAGDQSLELRSVSLPVWDMESCANVLGTSRKLPNGPMSDNQVCAGDRRGGKDTCQGDSGGPAQLQEDCIWRVVAVTSLGRSCGAPNTPGLYAKVQRAFIAAQVFGNQRHGNHQNRNINNHNNREENRNNNVNNNRHNIDSYDHNNQHSNSDNNKNSNNNHYRGIHNDENEHSNGHSNNNEYSTTQRNIYVTNNNRYNKQETTSNNYNTNEEQSRRYDQINHENDFNQQNHEININNHRENHHDSIGRKMHENNNEFNNNDNNRYYNYNTGDNSDSYFDRPTWT